MIRNFFVALCLSLICMAAVATTPYDGGKVYGTWVKPGNVQITFFEKDGATYMVERSADGKFTRPERFTVSHEIGDLTFSNAASPADQYFIEGGKLVGYSVGDRTQAYPALKSAPAASTVVEARAQADPVKEWPVLPLRKGGEKPRVVISSDIGGTDPDDNQSMTHLLMYSDMFDTEGLISSPSFGSGNKAEILRMIDVYEKDYPALSKRIKGLATPDYMRSITKMGRTDGADFRGWNRPTEGSDWIIQCGRRDDPRPLYVLVWGCLEDVAQALHDAPDIADKIRVYWIGGPNKKWGINGYAYIAENFPNLWMIEDNTSYRGFMFQPKVKTEWQAGYYDAHIKDHGNLGRDFAAYYKGNPKMGDTPSLLYVMSGDPADPESESWGGKFTKINRSQRRIFDRLTTARDTIVANGMMEIRLKDVIPNDTAKISMVILNQTWPGEYVGGGEYRVRYCTYTLGTHPYVINTNSQGFKPLKGEITVVNEWPGPEGPDDFRLGPNWWSDIDSPEENILGYPGDGTVLRHRQTVMADWAKRWDILKGK